MDRIEYILCHGSGNKFVMLDSVKNDLAALQTESFVQKICQCSSSDGVLFLNLDPSGRYVMRMFNTDGSEAEMCGNGMRCAARLANERYIHKDRFEMISGGKIYPITHAEAISKGVETYSVDINITTHTDDFTLGDDKFVSKKIEALDPNLLFTYLNLGNPHIVAMCDDIDLDHLSLLGEKVKVLKEIFPNGVNVSLIKELAPQQIFVATYERGVGLTASCGTAMTASCTASVLCGICRSGEWVEVRNRGGAVSCITHTEPSIVTTLSGNATFEARGIVNHKGQITESEPIEEEQTAWTKYIETLK